MAKEHNEFMRLAKKYPYIYAWGKKMGSHGYYIQNEMEQAEKDNAPANASYRKDDGTWQTADDHAPALLAELDDYIAGRRGGFTL